MKILYIQHVPFEGLGFIRHWAEARSDVLTPCYPYEPGAFPALDTFDALIIMGGPMGVHDVDEYPWLQDEIDFIKHAIDANKKVLGVCLGAQLIAKVLGAHVTKNQLPEIGWFPIRFIDDENMPDMVEVYHWHFDTFTLPQGAKRLAYSEATENQAFSYGQHVLALQCHLEMTPRIVQSLISRFSEVLDASQHFIQTAQQMLQDESRFEVSSHCLNKLLDHFFKDCK